MSELVWFLMIGAAVGLWLVGYDANCFDGKDNGEWADFWDLEDMWREAYEEDDEP